MSIKIILMTWLLLFSFTIKATDTLPPINKKILATAIVTQATLYAGEMVFLNYIWYRDRDRVPFHFYDDSKGYLQIDKFGHSLGAFIGSDICYHWLRKAGVSKNKALIFGGPMGLILQTPIEVFDGLNEGWGFSWYDMMANAAGSAFFVGQEILFDDQIVNFKFSFSPSPYAKDANGMLGDSFRESLMLDYNGHSYWLSTELNNLLPQSRLPKWLDISFGYSANGMYGEFENKETWNGQALPEAIRYRQFLVSLDIDWRSIKTDSYFLKQLFYVLNYIKIPFPALEYNTLGNLRFHPMYF